MGCGKKLQLRGIGLQRVFAVVVVGSILVAALCGTFLQPAFAYADGKQVAQPTQEEIVQKYYDLNLDKILDSRYSREPNLEAPYSPGTLSDGFQSQGIDALNWIRFVAGVPSDVAYDAGYAKQTQAAALLCALNGDLSHHPSQPSGMSDEMYQLGSAGAGSSNIFYGWFFDPVAYDYRSDPVASVFTYMDDSDEYNIAQVGHRRWCLNPPMGKSAFGMVDAFSAMYSFDKSNTAGFDYDMVVWPAANMPIEFFGADQAWSIGTPLSDLGESISVTLRRLSDGRVWNFSESSSDGDFYTDEDYWYDGQFYNCNDAVIFRPSDMDDYKDGDKFEVTVSGSKATKSYTVDFFCMAPNVLVDKGTWIKDGGDWWYCLADGTPAYGWQQIKGAWYYLGSDGWMRTNWTKIGGKYFYLGPDGAMRTGWTQVAGKWYYLRPGNGDMATNWLFTNGKYFYLGPDGAMRTGWTQVGKNWYYLKPGNGDMATGWVAVGNKRYYTGSDGAMRTGWTQVGNSWYYLRPGNGDMATGWVVIGGKYFYTGNDGAMVTGWAQAGGKWYYLRPGNGDMVTGWIQISGKWYYLRPGNGDMATGWVQVGGKWYYLNPANGDMLTNQWVGGTYWVDENGVMATNTWVDGGRYYVNGSGVWVPGYTGGSIPNETAVYAEGSDVYHIYNCRSASRIKNPITTTVAKAQAMGLVLCENCRNMSE